MSHTDLFNKLIIPNLLFISNKTSYPLVGEGGAAPAATQDIEAKGSFCTCFFQPMASLMTRIFQSAGGGGQETTSYQSKS